MSEQMYTPCEPGVPITINGLDGQYIPLSLDACRYEYGKGKNTECPNCGHRAGGVPWGGWFLCDAQCGALALIDTGQVFVKAER